MNTDISYEQDGKKFNQWGQEIIACALCNAPTTMLGTKRCDSCWELETRIRGDVAFARKILDGQTAKLQPAAEERARERRTQERRTGKSPWRSHYTEEKRTIERRTSPAIGEHAIQECARLRALNAELVVVLQRVLAHERDIVYMFNALGEGAPANFSLECEKARAAIAKMQP